MKFNLYLNTSKDQYLSEPGSWPPVLCAEYVKGILKDKLPEIILVQLYATQNKRDKTRIGVPVQISHDDYYEWWDSNNKTWRSIWPEMSNKIKAVLNGLDKGTIYVKITAL